MDDLTKADLARAVLENPVYKDTYEQLKTDLMNGWKMTAFNQTVEREAIWTSIILLEKIQTSFEIAISAGKMINYQDLLNDSINESARDRMV